MTPNEKRARDILNKLDAIDKELINATCIEGEIMGINEEDKKRLLQDLYATLDSSITDNSVVDDVLKEMSKWHIGEVIEILKHVRQNDRD